MSGSPSPRPWGTVSQHPDRSTQHVRFITLPRNSEARASPSTDFDNTRAEFTENLHSTTISMRGRCTGGDPRFTLVGLFQSEEQLAFRQCLRRATEAVAVRLLDDLAQPFFS